MEITVVTGMLVGAFALLGAVILWFPYDRGR